MGPNLFFCSCKETSRQQLEESASPIAQPPSTPTWQLTISNSSKLLLDIKPRPIAVAPSSFIAGLPLKTKRFSVLVTFKASPRATALRSRFHYVLSLNPSIGWMGRYYKELSQKTLHHQNTAHLHSYSIFPNHNEIRPQRDSESRHAVNRHP
mmetsp:Transcript_16956/g.25094  ORF Transcript_16956/g.25094 Transcript_16956/m.25094 type:complete len:152 (-) Transcript_16956:55-510(-)